MYLSYPYHFDTCYRLTRPLLHSCSNLWGKKPVTSFIVDLADLAVVSVRFTADTNTFLSVMNIYNACIGFPAIFSKKLKTIT